MPCAVDVATFVTSFTWNFEKLQGFSFYCGGTSENLTSVKFNEMSDSKSDMDTSTGFGWHVLNG